MSNKEIYYRDESKMHSIPKFLPIIMSLEFLAIIICSIAGIIFALCGNILIMLVMFGIVAVFTLHGAFCDKYYKWQDYVRYEIDKGTNSVVYKYNLNACAITSNPVVSIKIVSIDKLKLNGKTKITLWGTFRKKVPMRKEIELNKVQLQIDLKERNEILGVLNNIVERGK